jgi:hypothetical protein
MEITDTLRRYWVDYVISLIFAGVTFFIAPRLGITDSYLIFGLSFTIFLLISIVAYLFFQPSMEFGIFSILFITLYKIGGDALFLAMGIADVVLAATAIVTGW